jgi:hypothetical protein
LSFSSLAARVIFSLMKWIQTSEAEEDEAGEAANVEQSRQ